MTGAADESRDEPYPGVRRRAIDGKCVTVTEYLFEPFARFPVHRHAQEQITIVVEGDVDFTADGHVRRLTAGDWNRVAPDAAHGVQAGSSGARIFAVVAPRRTSSDALTVLD